MSGFEYLMALVSVVAGLSLARVLSGLTRMVHARRSMRLSDVHLVWTVNTLIWLVNFWWFTSWLRFIDGWTLPLFAFVLAYCAVIFLLVALLYPERLEGGTDMFEKFVDNRGWFFGTLLALALVDVADALYKTARHEQDFPSLGRYVPLIGAWVALSVAGMWVKSRLAHRLIAYAWMAIVVGLVTVPMALTTRL